MMMKRPDYRTTEFTRDENVVFQEFKAGQTQSLPNDEPGSLPEKPAEHDSDLPGWVLNPPTTDDAYYTAGYGKDRDLFTAMEKARRAANLELVKQYFGMKIERVEYEQDDKGGFWVLVEIEKRDDDSAFAEFRAQEALKKLDETLLKQGQTEQAEE